MRQQSVSHRKHLPQPGHRIGTVIIGIPARIVSIAPDDSFRNRGLHHRVSAGAFVVISPRLALAVSPFDGKAVVTARALHVSVRKIGGAVGANLYSRSEVIH